MAVCQRMRSAVGYRRIPRLDGDQRLRELRVTASHDEYRRPRIHTDRDPEASKALRTRGSQSNDQSLVMSHICCTDLDRLVGVETS